MEHEFTLQILQILQEAFGEDGMAIYERSPLLQYLNIKTRSAAQGSKSRGSFANLYAVYVLVEDYLKSNDEIDLLLARLREGAKKQYGVKTIVEKYMTCIEEVINIPILLERFEAAKAQGYLRDILDEIVTQSKVEFNFQQLSN